MPQRHPCHSLTGRARSLSCTAAAQKSPSSGATNASADNRMSFDDGGCAKIMTAAPRFTPPRRRLSATKRPGTTKEQHLCAAALLLSQLELLVRVHRPEMISVAYRLDAARIAAQEPHSVDPRRHIRRERDGPSTSLESLVPCSRAKIVAESPPPPCRAACRKTCGSRGRPTAAR